MIRAVCLFALLALATAASLSVDQEWESFKVKHGKAYVDEKEEAHRRSVFAQNLKKIKAHNKQADNGMHTFRLGANRFADLTFEEFKTTHLGLRKPELKRRAPLIHVNKTVDASGSVDWREKGIVTDVKDQQQCGSCWAFSATAAIEAALAQKTGKLVSLSEQQLLDCSWAYDNAACNGGLPDSAFEYVKDNKGIDSESSYPYISGDGTSYRKCHYKEASKVGSISSYVDVAEGNENALLSAVNEHVVSIAFDAEYEFQLYDSGIFNSRSCSKENLNHGVAIVGYGSANGSDYWIVRNSWGSSWGEKGYVRVIRGKNMCGIAEMASYPVV